MSTFFRTICLIESHCKHVRDIFNFLEFGIFYIVFMFQVRVLLRQSRTWLCSSVYRSYHRRSSTRFSLSTQMTFDVSRDRAWSYDRGSSRGSSRDRGSPMLTSTNKHYLALTAINNNVHSSNSSVSTRGESKT